MEEIKNILQKYITNKNNLNAATKEISTLISQYSDNGLINEKLKPISDYVLSFERDTDKGWYVANFGIPASWEIKDNEDIGFELVNETDVGKLIKIFPKREGVIFDDLVLFIKIIVKTNEKIAAKEKEFNEKIEQMKKGLEDEVKNFYSGLDQFKKQAFERLDLSLENEFKTVDGKTNEENEEDGDDNEEESDSKNKKIKNTDTETKTDE